MLMSIKIMSSPRAVTAWL